MIRTVLAEDEPHSLERLRGVLAARPDLEIVGEATDGPSAAALVEALHPDLLFLDIHMPGCDGFEVLSRLEHRPMVVFVTAYDEYALKAFDANAVDYLLKPSSRKRIFEAVDRALARRKTMDGHLFETLKAALAPQSHLRRFLVKVGDEILVIPEAEVLCFQAEDKYVNLLTEGRSFITDFTLKELEQRLDPERFVRIHKSTIIALHRVSRISKWFQGEQIVVLDDKVGTRLKVGRSYVENFRNRMG
ncbi:MAG: LytTR family DNA-binding domain-containing protein [Holophaga sp.]|nr:LytTR family DNA-binding domain-containing protein [Holophaga sp.]